MKKKYLTILLFFLLAVTLYSQTDTTGNESVRVLVDEMPEFPGGNVEMMKFIQKNIVYPQAEREKGIGGTCYVTFVVERDGNISDVRVLRGVPGGPGFDKEAVRVVSIMPRWKPGKQNGREVRVQFNIPIKFTNMQMNTPKQLSPEDKEKINTANIHYNKGVEFAKKDEYGKALEEFDEVLKILPKDVEALYNKGFMYYKLNRNQDACAIWIELKKSGNSIADNMLNKTCFSDSTKDSIFTRVEKMPSFPGGLEAMMKFIQKNSNLPKEAYKASGASYITFIVEKDGTLTDIKVLKGAYNCPSCDSEAIRVISKMPRWDPGIQNGKNVRVQFNLPIKFSTS